MAGYGNRTGPSQLPSDMEEEHNNTRFGINNSDPYSGGHETFGSGTTGGAGFGNKHKSSQSSSSTDDKEVRFSTRGNSEPYSGHSSRQYGSGSVGGAGWGNKTGSFSESHDSTMGKLMEKAGHMMHNDKMAEKGRAKREEAGFGQK